MAGQFCCPALTLQLNRTHCLEMSSYHDGSQGAFVKCKVWYQMVKRGTGAPFPQGDANCAVEKECEALEWTLHEGTLVWQIQALVPLCLSASPCCAQGHRSSERPGLDLSQVCLFPLHTVHTPDTPAVEGDKQKWNAVNTATTDNGNRKGQRWEKGGMETREELMGSSTSICFMFVVSWYGFSCCSHNFCVCVHGHLRSFCSTFYPMLDYLPAPYNKKVWARHYAGYL